MRLKIDVIPTRIIHVYSGMTSYIETRHPFAVYRRGFLMWKRLATFETLDEARTYRHGLTGLPSIIRTPNF